ncbi:hypothetical protein DIPPA_00783 [Diplonema papillatum]|nr:hypothetical protein DIPPA_00783 [Diplonema papillatum]
MHGASPTRGHSIEREYAIDTKNYTNTALLELVQSNEFQQWKKTKYIPSMNARRTEYLAMQSVRTRRLGYTCVALSIGALNSSWGAAYGMHAIARCDTLGVALLIYVLSYAMFAAGKPGSSMVTCVSYLVALWALDHSDTVGTGPYLGCAVAAFKALLNCTRAPFRENDVAMITYYPPSDGTPASGSPLVVPPATPTRNMWERAGTPPTALGGRPYPASANTTPWARRKIV